MTTPPTALFDRLVDWNARRTTDVFFVGYPKTGNTWVRFLVGRYLQRRCGAPETPLFDGYDRLGRCQRACTGPSMHFTHRPLEWETQTAGDLSDGNVVRPLARSRVVLLVRHPLDALVSSWFQAVYRTASPYRGDLAAFIDDPVHGLDKLVRFYELWDDGRRRRTSPTMLLRYEDLRSSTEPRFMDLLRFLGLDVVDDDVQEAVAWASFENMRAMETAGAPRYRTGANVFATGDPAEPQARHVRRGKVGGYRDELSADDAARFEERIARSLPAWYGYS